MPSGAAELIAALESYGVNCLFHIPGAETIPLLHEIGRHGGIRPIMVAHEQAASFGALGYAKLSGLPGVCLTIPGPGATNLVTGVAAAHADRIPLLAITTTIPAKHKGLGAAHDCDIAALFRPIVKRQIAVARVGEVRDAASEALRVALEPPLGPVQLLVPPPLFLAHCAANNAAVPTRAAISVPNIAAVADMLMRAKRPVIYAGKGVSDAGAKRLLVQLAERLGAPVLTDICARGLIDERHPSALGCVSHRGIVPFLAEGDLCLAIGAGFSDWSTLGWTLPLPRPLIQIDSWDAPVGAYERTDARAIGDVPGILESLLVALGDGHVASDVAPRIRAVKAEAAELTIHAISGARPPPFHPLAVLHAVHDVLPDDTVVVVDGSATGLWAEEEVLAIRRPRGFLIPEVLKELGSAIMVAMGARLAPGGPPVVAIQGDGGFLYQAGELATLVRERIPLVIILFDDGFYNADRIVEQHFFGGRKDAWRIGRTDFVTVAEGFGLIARRPASIAEIEGDLREALGADRPMIIVVAIDPEPIPYRFELAKVARSSGVS